MKIGFIDHHLNNYHANVFHKLLTGTVGGGEVEIVAAWESNPAGEDWCATFKVPRVESCAGVIDKSDAIVVLAPDSLDAHLELATPALESGKPVLIDKILSTNLADARKIVDLAEKYETPLMSSSSLRFSVELEEALTRVTGPVEAVFSRGFGNWSGYSIHTIAPALRLLGGRVRRVIDTGDAKARIVTVDTGSGRALIEVREAENQQEAAPWQLGMLSGNRYEVVTVRLFEEFYANLMRETVKFFKTGKSPVSTGEMLDSVVVLTAAEESLAQGCKWIEVTV
jgi:predicted dehydrogenase